MAVFGIVILLYPVVPLSPATVKVTVVDLADWFVTIVALDICELVMFPLIARLTVTPLSVVAVTFVAIGFGVGDGIAVGVGVDVGIRVGVGVDVEGEVGIGVGVGGSVGEGVGVGAGVGAIVTVNKLLVTE
jgi:hypothetical protein